MRPPIFTDDLNLQRQSIYSQCYGKIKRYCSGRSANQLLSKRSANTFVPWAVPLFMPEVFHFLLFLMSVAHASLSFKFAPRARSHLDRAKLSPQ